MTNQNVPFLYSTLRISLSISIGYLIGPLKVFWMGPPKCTLLFTRFVTVLFSIYGLLKVTFSVKNSINYIGKNLKLGKEPLILKHVENLKVVIWKRCLVIKSCICLYLLSDAFSSHLFGHSFLAEGGFISKKKTPVVCHSLVLTDIQGRSCKLKCLRHKLTTLREGALIGRRALKWNL